MPLAPILKASRKDRALIYRQIRWTVRSRPAEDTTRPRLRRVPRPTQPANTLGLVNMEVIRTPSSTALRLV